MNTNFLFSERLGFIAKANLSENNFPANKYNLPGKKIFKTHKPSYPSKIYTLIFFF